MEENMSKFEYIPQGVCSKKMIFDVEGDIVKDVKIIGGCPGNSLGVSMLVKDRHIDEVINKLKDIRCGFKSTSCPQELAKGLQQYKNNK